MNKAKSFINKVYSTPELMRQLVNSNWDTAQGVAMAAQLGYTVSAADLEADAQWGVLDEQTLGKVAGGSFTDDPGAGGQGSTGITINL